MDANTPINPDEFESVRILRLQPGDEIVVRVSDRGISSDDLRRIKSTAEGLWPGHRIVVLHNGIDIEVVRS